MILLTGATGFIGNPLFRKLGLLYGKEKVVALSSQPVDDGRYILHNNYSFEPNYLIDNGLDKIETIIHAGAFIPKRGNSSNDWKACNSNIINTDVLYSLMLPNLKRVIFLSTIDVYGYTDNEISEQSDVAPVSLYGASKLYCEKLTQAFAYEKELVCQILRIGHTYGPGEESYQKVIPNTIKRVLNGLSPQIWGTGNELRAFIYIEDVVNSIINSVNYDFSLGVVNIVSGQSITINNLVKTIRSFSDGKSEVEFFDREIKGTNFRFNNNRLKEYLLKKETSFEVGLNQEFNYFKNLHDKNIL